MKIATLGSRGKNNIYFFRNPGVSQYAALIRDKSDEYKTIFARTESYGEYLSKILEALLQARKEYSDDNWDGYNAKKLDVASFDNSLKFALSLPSKTPVPDIDITPSGQVVFSWNKGNRRLFSVIVGRRNELSYAGLFGANRIYGIEYFNENIPIIILNNIERVFSS